MVVVVVVVVVLSSSSSSSSRSRSRSSRRRRRRRAWADRLATFVCESASFCSLFMRDFGFRQVPEITSKLRSCD